MRRKTILSVFLALALMSPVASPLFATAATRRDLAKHRRAADVARRKAAAEQQKANALVAQTNKLEDRIQTVSEQLAELESQVGTATERVTHLQRQVELLRGGLDAQQRQVEDVKTQYVAQTEALAARMDAMYRSGDWAYIEWLLNSRSVTDLFERTSLVQVIMENDDAIARDLDSTRVRYEQIALDLSRTLDTVEATRQEAKVEQDRLRTLQARRDAKLQAEQNAKREKQSLLAESKKNIAHLRAIAAAEDRESAAIAAELRRGSSSGSGRYSGTMTWPTPGYTTIGSRFGMRYHPILHYNRMHTGIDIRVGYGRKIVAAGSGVVIYAGRRGGYGNCTMIDHGDGLVTLYGHQSAIVVRNGQRVIAGQQIGRVGSTGLSTGPHLHFEVRVNGTPRNPLNYL